MPPPLAYRSRIYRYFLNRDPETQQKRAHLALVRLPNERLHARLRAEQPRELTRDMQTHVARISDHIPRRRASSSELRVRRLVPSGLLLKIDVRRASAGPVVVWRRSKRIRFPEQPRELAEQRGPVKKKKKSSVSAEAGGRAPLACVLLLLTMFSHWAL